MKPETLNILANELILPKVRMMLIKENLAIKDEDIEYLNLLKAVIMVEEAEQKGANQNQIKDFLTRDVKDTVREFLSNRFSNLFRAIERRGYNLSSEEKAKLKTRLTKHLQGTLFSIEYAKEYRAILRTYPIK